MKKKEKVLYGSIGGGGSIIIIGILLYIYGESSIGSSLFLAGLIGAFLPYALYTYFESRKFDAFEKEFPNLMRDLAESKQSGRSLPQAIEDSKKNDYGRLNEEVNKISNQLSWGVPFPEVLERFKKRMESSELISRSVSIVIQAYRSGGNIAQTMESIAEDASKIKEAEKERSATLHQQVLIIYAIYIMFVVIVIVLNRIMAPLLKVAGSIGGGLMGGGGTINFCSLGITQPICSICPILDLGSAGTKTCYYKALFFFMVIIQGIFNGLVAGHIEQGKLAAGIKHSLLMVPVGFLAYVIFI